MSSVAGEIRGALARYRALARLRASAQDVRIDPTVHVRSPDRLRLGAGVFIDAGAVLHCGGMSWSPADGGIRIGAHAYIGPNTTLFGAAGIEIGESALISPGVVITSHQHTFARGEVEIRHQPLQFARVVIERDVWIGANATILPGVRIGAGSVIGAGAVVTADIEAGKLAVGVPARVKHDR